MKTEAKSIVQMARGAILERCDYEMSRVMDNIMDPNTKATAKRRIVLALEFKPDGNRQLINVEATAKSSLCPTDPIAVSLYTGIEQGRFVAVEMSGNIPGQTDMSGGEEAERTVLKFPAQQSG